MMLVLLTACAILGFFSFLDMFRGEWGSVVTKDARITLGVSAYLFANTIIYEESGIAAATLVTFLGWLINDAVRRAPKLAKWRAATPTISATLLLIYAGIYIT